MLRLGVSRAAIVVFDVLLFLGVAALDRATGAYISVGVFYLVPIAIAAWSFGMRAGILLALLGAGMWISVQLGSPVQRVHLALLCGNGVLRALLYLSFAVCLSLLNETLKKLREEERQGRILAQAVLDAQEEERARIARELHDESNQKLTALTFKIEHLKSIASAELEKSKTTPIVEELNGLKHFTEEIVKDLRRLSVNIRPKLLDDLGLREALSSLFGEQLENAGVRSEFAWSIGETKLPRPIELAIFRIAQEAISNVLKHAAAKNVRAGLSLNGTCVQLDVRDDGKGFEPGDIFRRGDREQHLGILGMKERASLMRGELHIESSPGAGTLIRAFIPFQTAGGDR